MEILSREMDAMIAKRKIIGLVIGWRILVLKFVEIQSLSEEKIATQSSPSRTSATQAANPAQSTTGTASITIPTP